MLAEIRKSGAPAESHSQPQVVRDRVREQLPDGAEDLRLQEKSLAGDETFSQGQRRSEDKGTLIQLIQNSLLNQGTEQDRGKLIWRNILHAQHLRISFLWKEILVQSWHWAYQTHLLLKSKCLLQMQLLLIVPNPYNHLPVKQPVHIADTTSPN